MHDVFCFDFYKNKGYIRGRLQHMFLQSFEQRIAAMEQKIAAMEKNMVLEIPDSEPYTPGAEENQM
jgi:hypothetical protein